jgi:hypothetical protein
VRIMDLPVSGQRVRLWWRKRRLLCLEVSCPAVVVHRGHSGDPAAVEAHGPAACTVGERDRRIEPGSGGLERGGG